MQSWSFSLSSCLGNSSVNFLKLFNSRCSPEALQHEVISHEQNPDIFLMLQMIKPLLAQRAGICIDIVKTDLCLCNRRRVPFPYCSKCPRKLARPFCGAYLCFLRSEKRRTLLFLLLRNTAKVYCRCSSEQNMYECLTAAPEMGAAEVTLALPPWWYSMFFRML